METTSNRPLTAEEFGRLRVRRFDPTTFRWEGIPDQVYQGPEEPAPRFRDVIRRTLVPGGATPAAFEVRYFEVGPGGYSRLELHQHIHAVLILRGEGEVQVGDEVHRVRPFDLIYVPPETPHQFRHPGGEGDEPFGFLCVVDAQRDRPRPLDP
ncbi:MAG TPA: cupin domain-containing protein [Thermaerobacter sp.]